MSLAAHLAPHTARLHIATPWGGVLLARSGAGLTGLWLDGQKDHPGQLPHVPEDPHDALLRECAKQLSEYAQGFRRAFDVPLDLHGTEFQRQVWQALLSIPAGELRTYGEVAYQLNRPRASRAVGMAVGLNPISIIVPCHRVIGSQGNLTGYSGGMHRKVALLELEGIALQGQRVCCA